MKKIIAKCLIDLGLTLMNKILEPEGKKLVIAYRYNKEKKPKKQKEKKSSNNKKPLEQTELFPDNEGNLTNKGF